LRAKLQGIRGTDSDNEEEELDAEKEGTEVEGADVS
jgi:hypothetical protein